MRELSDRKESSDKKSGSPGGDKRVGATRAVSTLVSPLTRRALGKHGFASASLISDWATIIGGELAASCHPIKLAFPQGKRDGGTLHLHVTGGAALEIQHMTPQVIERINGHLGYRAVERVRLVQGQKPRNTAVRTRRLNDRRIRRPAAPLDCPALDEVTDPALRESLQRLGRAIAEHESRAKK